MRALMFLLLASCTHEITVFEQVDVKPARDLDILYVLDNSNNRGAYDQMAGQLGDLQTQLASVDGRAPSLHVGVVTTDLGTRGTLDAQPRAAVGRCAGDGDAARLVTFNAGLGFGSFLEDLRGPGDNRIRNFNSSLGGELARLTNPAFDVASDGCDFPQPLEAMRRALDPATNPGFIRPDAMLSIVFLTNQDDCSLARGAMLDPLDTTLGPPAWFRCTEQGIVCDADDVRKPGAHSNCRPRTGSPYMVDVADYQTFLTGYKPDPKDVTVAAVVGAPGSFQVQDIGRPQLAPSCQGAGGVALPAVRLGALVTGLGGAMVDACTQDAAYQKIAAPIVDHQRTCFANLRASDGDDCTVTETAAGADTELARCGDGASSPCWYTYQDAAGCPAGDHIGIAIDRGDAAAPMGATIKASCVAR